jgi:hypothetical protein
MSDFSLIDLGGLAAVTLVLVKVLGPVARALAHRIEGRTLPSPVDDPVVDHLRADVAELQERLDFLERAVASREPPPELPPQRTPG